MTKNKNSDPINKLIGLGISVEGAEAQDTIEKVKPIDIVDTADDKVVDTTKEDVNDKIVVTPGSREFVVGVRRNAMENEIKADFSKGYDMRGVDLSNTSLCSSIFTNCNLENVDFSNADMRGVNLSGVSVKGANFKGANVNFSILPKSFKADAIYDKTTSLNECIYE